MSFLIKIDQLESGALPSLEPLGKVDEPVTLLVMDRDGHWGINKEIKIRESKRQRGLVSFELQDQMIIYV